MAKWSGNIGFSVTAETVPGVWEEQIQERRYYGDLIRSIRKTENSSAVNDNINISNQISIVADPFANENLFSMKYITFSGSKWKIRDVEVQYPRLILSIGGVYNGEQTGTTE